MEQEEKNALKVNDLHKHNSYGAVPRDGEALLENEENIGCCAKFYPTGFWRGLKDVMKSSAPLILQQLTIYMLAPVALMFCGHLGKVELDAVALANSFGNIFGISVGVGMGAACDTYFSQVYGSGNKLKMGVVLQRAFLISCLPLLVTVSLLINTEALALLLGQQEDVARLAGEYITLLIPGIVFLYFFLPLMKFIQNQNLILPTLIIGVLSNVGNIVLHYLLIYVANMNIYGSAIAQSITYFLFFLLSMLYIIFSGLHKTSWNGWSMECLSEWGPFAYLGISGLLMIGIEWWSFEAGIILAGLLGTTQLGAQSLVFQIEVIAYMFPLGNGIATSIKVGQFLGSSDPIAAKTIARVGITFIVMTGITIGILLTALKDYLPYIFTNDREVAELAADVLPVVGVYMLFDSVSGTCGGIMRGSGRQSMGAIIVAIGYAIALSIGTPLMLITELGVVGFWLGLMIALMIIAALESLLIYRMDWEKEAQKASARVGGKTSATLIVESSFVKEKDPLLISNGKVESKIDKGETNDHCLEEDAYPAKRNSVRRDICRSVFVYAIFISIFTCALCIRLVVIKQGGPLFLGEPLAPSSNSTTPSGLLGSTFNLTTPIVTTG